MSLQIDFRLAKTFQCEDKSLENILSSIFFKETIPIILFT